MKILLTGATGFVGRALLQSFSSEDEVICLVRSAPQEELQNVRFIETDISHRESVQHASESIDGDIDVLIHLAAYVPKEGSKDILDESYQTNVVGTINLLKVFAAKVKRFVIGSTVEVYDQSKIHGVITEDSVVGAGSYYGVTKLASELIAQTYAKKENLSLIVLRFSVMYGPNDPITRALPNFIKSALKNEPITVNGGNKLRDYVSVDDVVRSIHAAASADARGVVNIGSGKGVSIRDAVQVITEKTHSSSQVSYETSDTGTDIVIDPTAAKENINFQATDFFPDKLDEMIESYK